ncbi:MAG TPA: LuxR C-terminal-related transcriptional regulator, partial [Herpetosiphonaceae bacterium]
ALATALAGFAAAGDDAGRGAVLAELAAMAFLGGDFERSGRLVDEGLAVAGAIPPSAQVALLLGRSRLAFVRRQWPLAQQSFDQALALCERLGDPAAYAQLVKYANLTMIAGLPGGLERLERLVRGAEAWPVGPGGFPPGPAEIALDAHRAIIALWRGDLERSIAAGERARSLARRLGGALPHLEVLLPSLLGMVHLACGHGAEADACFADALARIEQGSIAAPLVAGALSNLARARLLQGRPAEAQLVYERLVALDPGSVPALPFLVMLLRGLLALAGERFEEAEQALHQAVMIEQIAGGTTLIFGSARLALAQFYLRRGRQREALAALGPALEECAREQRLGLVLREGRSMIPLLRLAAQQGVGGPLAVALLRLLGAGAGPRPLRDPQTGETLSAREVEVLRLLLDGATNQQIADALTISLPTVKTHLLHIFQKLQVRTRTQAAARARELLPPA